MGGALIIMALVVPDAALVRPAQRAGLAGAAGHRRLRRDRLRRRLPEALAARTSKGLPGKLKLLGQFADRRRGDHLALHGDALPPEARLRLALPLALHHFERYPHRRCRSWSTSSFAVIVRGRDVERRQPDRRPRRPGHRPGDRRPRSPSCCPRPTAAGDRRSARHSTSPHTSGSRTCPAPASWPIFCGAMVGAGVGFLWYNTHPAQVFMGDVGALALGGAIGMLAVADQDRARAADHRRRLRARGVSDIIQVAYYKLTGQAHLPDGADPPPLRD